MANKIKKNEFRKGNTAKTLGHPTYIYAQEGKKLKYIGITHSAVTENTKNIELEQNPEPGNNTKAYIRPKPAEAHKASFGKKLKGWTFSKKDKEKVEAVKKKGAKK